MWRAYVTIGEVFSEKFLRWACIVLVAFLVFAGSLYTWTSTPWFEPLQDATWMGLALGVAALAVVPLLLDDFSFLWRDFWHRDKREFRAPMVTNKISWALIGLRIVGVIFGLGFILDACRRFLVFPVMAGVLHPAIGSIAILLTTVLLAGLLTFLVHRWMGPIKQSGAVQSSAP